MAAIYRLIIVFVLLLWCTSVWAGDIRPPVWAGKFYPADPDQLRQTIAGLIQKADRDPSRPLPKGRLHALILPHAGYLYSGWTAAHAHRSLTGLRFDKVVLMGPDHRVGFSGASVSDVAAYRTPLGTVALHADAHRLRASGGLFRSVPDSDAGEHSLEVVLPFLQYDLPPFSLVPIVVGQCDPEQVGRALVPYIDDGTLLVASADLSHYLSYDRARAMDNRTVAAILSLDAVPIVTEDNRTCGRYPVAALIYLAHRFGWHPVLLHYANSGDTAGDRKAVVGYAAIAFYGENKMSSSSPTSRLSEEQGRTLLELARETLNRKFGQEPASDQAAALAKRLDDPALQTQSGTFVTLKIGENLRGCIGSLIGHEPLVEGVRSNAVNAAFHDPRFRPLTEAELTQVDIEVSVLTEPQPLDYTDEDDLIARLRPGVDGVILRKGGRSATFLPQVWEQLPRAEDFLSHLCMKAGLSTDAWRHDKLEVETYQVQYFEESH